MRKFKRRGDVITTQLSNYEVELLSSLVEQLIEVVTGGEPELQNQKPLADPFEELARDLQPDPDAPETPEDPVVRRLFPDAYPHDAAASSDFRRFTERELRNKKVTDARTVLSRLAETRRGSAPLRIPAEEVDAWLRTLTSLRLSVATRLGITDVEAAEELAQLPDSDPRAFLVSVYDWLGFAQETLVLAL